MKPKAFFIAVANKLIDRGMKISRQSLGISAGIFTVNDYVDVHVGLGGLPPGLAALITFQPRYIRSTNMSGIEKGKRPFYTLESDLNELADAIQNLMKDEPRFFFIDRPLDKLSYDHKSLINGTISLLTSTYDSYTPPTSDIRMHFPIPFYPGRIDVGFSGELEYSYFIFDDNRSNVKEGSLHTFDNRTDLIHSMVDDLQLKELL